jgi:2,3,4,5-tetrahydropyridine-2-carboxylate N-succinyltransferase
MIAELKKAVEDAWEDRNLLNFKEYRNAIEKVIHHLDL